MPTPSNSPALTYSNFAQYVAQTMYAAKIGTVAAIPNAMATASLDTAILTDPARIAAFRDSFASQMNAQSAGPRFEDLSDRIADVIITTSAQGASTLELHLIDPMWVLPQWFIQADEAGYLLPIDVNFPTGTECWWRMVQYRPSWAAGTEGPNLVLTFEDRIVSLLRDVSPGNGGIQQGQPNQTLVAFMQMLVDGTNKLLKPKPPIKLVSLIGAQDPNATVQITKIPKNAEKKLQPSGLTKQLQAILKDWNHFQLGAFPDPPGSHGGGSRRISEIERLAAGKLAQLQAAASPQIGLLPNEPQIGRELGYTPATT